MPARLGSYEGPAWTVTSATEQQWAMRAQRLGFLVFTKGLIPALTLRAAPKMR